MALMPKALTIKPTSNHNIYEKPIPNITFPAAAKFFTMERESPDSPQRILFHCTDANQEIRDPKTNLASHPTLVL